jgi:hypothetical protein
MNKQTTKELAIKTAVKWFMSLPVLTRCNISDKYYPEYAEDNLDLNDEQVEHIYLSEHPQTETMVEDWDLYPGNEAGAFDHLDNLEDDIYGRHPQIKEEDVQVGGLPDKLDVHSTGLFPMKAELHPINDPDGLIILADVQTMELANEIVKRYNNFDAMYSSLQKLIRYSELLANNSHASRHVPIEEAKAIINQIDKQ